MTKDTSRDLEASQSERQEWLPTLVIGLVASLLCPLTDSLMGGPVASDSVRLASAGMGALLLAHAAFGARRAPKRDKLICGAWVAFGTVFVVLDFVAAASI